MHCKQIKTGPARCVLVEVQTDVFIQYDRSLPPIEDDAEAVVVISQACPKSREGFAGDNGVMMSRGRHGSHSQMTECPGRVGISGRYSGRHRGKFKSRNCVRADHRQLLAVEIAEREAEVVAPDFQTQSGSTKTCHHDGKLIAGVLVLQSQLTEPPEMLRAALRIGVVHGATRGQSQHATRQCEP